MTGSARRFLITNAYENNKFAIVRSVDGNTDPVVNSTGSGVNSGTADFTIDNGGNSTFSGSITVGTGNSSIEGDLYFGVNADIFKNSGDLLLDVAGDISLDADGGDIRFKDGGTTIGTLNNTSSDFCIVAGVQDKDIIFKGDDGGSAITALTLDMSAAGAATFNSTLAAAETTITTTGTSTALQVISTDAGASASPILDLYRNSSSAADGDILGLIKFTGNSGGSGAHTYGQIRMENNGVTDGQEQGKMIFDISMPDGDLAQGFHIGRTEIAVNESAEDLNFRAESVNHPYMLYLDAGNNRVGINLPTSKVTGGDVPAHPFEAWDDDEVTRFGVANNAAYVQRYQTHATGPATLVFDKARGTVDSPTTSANGDDLGRIIFRGYTDNGMYEAASIHAEVHGAGIGTGADIPGDLYFKTTADGGTATERMRLTADGLWRGELCTNSNSNPLGSGENSGKIWNQNGVWTNVWYVGNDPEGVHYWLECDIQSLDGYTSYGELYKDRNGRWRVVQHRQAGTNFQVSSDNNYIQINQGSGANQTNSSGNLKIVRIPGANA